MSFYKDFENLKKKYYPLYHDELFNSCAPFWLKHTKDEKYGGTKNRVDRFGRVYSNDKSVWMQGRTAWLYSYLNNCFGENQEYLDFAKSCLDFEDKYCIDEDGRMFFIVTEDGKPLRKRRYFFSETFYILGNAEYYIATGDKKRLEKAKKYYDFVYSIYKDPSNDPFKITPKSYSSTRPLKAFAGPMIMLNVTSVMKRADIERKEYYNEITKGLVEDFKKFYVPEIHAVMEQMYTDNVYRPDCSDTRIVNPGHDIEGSWFLLEIALENNDKQLMNFAKTVFDDAIERGYDKKYGGIVYFKDSEGNPVEAYEHDMKLWWVHNEALIASLMLYKTFKDKKYRDWFVKLTKYSFKHFSDRQYGEWYGYLRRDGKPTEPACKGHAYKCGFHVIRCLSKVLNMFDDRKEKSAK